MKKDGSHLTMKEELLYGNNNISKRPMSAVVERPNSCLAKKLPRVANTIGDIQLTPVTSQKSFGHVIEKEKLFEETLQLKLVIQRLKKELSLITNENKIKDYQLTVKEHEIKEIIEDFETPEYISAGQDTNLIGKMKHQYRILKKEYEDEVEQGELLKQNAKLTKMNELSIENEMMKSQIDKVNALYQNSCSINEANTKKLNEYSKVAENIHKQNIILEALKENLVNSMAKEQSLSVEIEELKGKCKHFTEVINKTNEDNEVLYKQNDSLANAKANLVSSGNGSASRKKLISSHSITGTKETYMSKIADLENQIKFFKSQNKRHSQRLSQMSTQKADLEKVKKLNKADMAIDYKVIKNNPVKADAISTEEQLKQLKQILDDSKRKEEALEKQLASYQEKVRTLISSSHLLNDQAAFGLSKDNPFYTEAEDNSPIDTKKLTAIQYNQFTYILFKNFEAKRITKDIANEKIIKPTIEGDINDITLEVIVARMTKAILALLNCSHSKDKQRLEIYLTALFYNFDGDINKIVESFLLLFAYIEDYSGGKEEKIKAKLATKHKDKFDQLKESIAMTNDKYISLLKVKEILDEKSIELKDKYIEFLFYKMKQFDDENASLFDLNGKKLEELFELSTSNLNENESVQEITTEQYEKIIKESLGMINKALSARKVSFRELIKESIVKMSQLKNKDVISIEDLNDALRKVNVHLEDLYLSCLCTKYCEDDNEQRVLSVAEFEKDLKSFNLQEEHYTPTDHDHDHANDGQKYEESDHDHNLKHDHSHSHSHSDDKGNDNDEEEYYYEDKEEKINKTQ